MTILRNLLIGLTSLLILGCFGTKVDRLSEGTRFREIRTTADMTGVFRNQGHSARKEWQPLLSDVLFPGKKFEEQPGEIRFRSKMPSGLRCEALSYGKTLAVNELLDGRDFRITDGGIQLDPKFLEPILSAAGIGVATESSLIRLAETGDAVLSSRGGALGLMLFIVPFGMTESQDALFERLE
jgi:hypothetical protein